MCGSIRYAVTEVWLVGARESRSKAQEAVDVNSAARYVSPITEPAFVDGSLRFPTADWKIQAGGFWYLRLKK